MTGADDGRRGSGTGETAIAEADAPTPSMTASPTIAIVGLGYVGLPLAVEFGKRYATIGFDLSVTKVAAYKRGVDPTREVSSAELKASTGLGCTTDATELKKALWDFLCSTD